MKKPGPFWKSITNRAAARRRAAVILAALGVCLAGATRGQSFTEYPIPTASSAPWRIAAGPDGNLWFTEQGQMKDGDKIGRITTAGVITEFRTPTPASSPQGITAGPDGNMWFTEWVGKIGRITPSGVITEFGTQFVSPAGIPWEIVTGPDGNLWFSEYNTNRVGRITPAGVITEYALPGFHQGRGIAAGSDGNLWWVDVSTHEIDRVTPAGVITTFPIPSTGGIANGPDGNLWFTEVGRVGRLNPTSGDVTHFGPFPCYTEFLTRGPDGNLWCANGNQLDRVTTAGVIDVFTLPTTAVFQGGIAAGPDGALWITEYYGIGIGRYLPGRSCSTISLSPATLPAGTVGMAYTPTTLVPVGGTAPYSFTVSGLPAGMTPTGQVTGPSVTIAGTPTASFSGTVNVSGTDADICSFSQNYALTIHGCTPPFATISAPPQVCPLSLRNAASVPDAGPGATYAWTISNGTITAGAGTSAITFSAGPSGSVSLNVTVTDASGCSANGSQSVPVVTCGASFYTVPACRLLDTRRPAGPYGGPSLSAGGSRVFVVAGGSAPCGIPSTATAVAINLVVVSPTDGPGFLAIDQAGAVQPLTSAINYNPGKTRANNAVVSLGPVGDVAVFCWQRTGTADLIIDVSGYFQ